MSSTQSYLKQMEEWKAEGLITDANQLKGVDAAVGAAGTGDDFVVKAIYDACEIRVKTLLSQKTREDEVKTKRHGFEKGLDDASIAEWIELASLVGVKTRQI
jgi:hypothetical protein